VTRFTTADGRWTVEVVRLECVSRARPAGTALHTPRPTHDGAWLAVSERTVLRGYFDPAALGLDDADLADELLMRRWMRNLAGALA
jgi:hypothetical protein